MKLYEVTITVKALVLAESERQASLFQREIIDTENANVSVENYSGLPPKWTPSTLVYHDQGGDITVAQALGAAASVSRVGQGGTE